MNVELRPYQIKGINMAFDALKEGFKKIIIVLAMGLGKTTLMGRIIQMGYQRGRKILIIVHRDNLVRQFSERLATQFNVPTGYILGTEKKDYTQQVQVASRQSLARRLSDFPHDHFDLVVIDETQYAAAAEYQKILKHFEKAPIIGLSVGPDSLIELKGGEFGDGFVGTIEEAWNILLLTHSVNTINGYEIIITKNIFTRGFESGKFLWKQTKTFIRHACTKDCTNITVAGDNLLLTNDHSIYKIDTNGKITEAETHTICPKDTLIYDDAYSGPGDKEISVIDFYAQIGHTNKIHVAVSLDSISHETFKANGINYKQKWAYKNGKHGNYLPILIYLKMRDTLPPPKFIYREGSESWILPQIKISDYAYLIGFYYGNGWFGENSISIAVKDKIVERVVKEFNNLPNTKSSVRIKQTKGKNKEIILSNHLLFVILSSYLENKKSYEKRLNSRIIIEWASDKKQEVLRGLIDSDGHISAKHGRIYYTTTSELLARTINSLLRSAGTNGYIYQRKTEKNNGGAINGRKINGNRQAYIVSWSQYSQKGIHNKHKGFKNKVGEINAPIVKKTTKGAPPPSHVYDIEVEGHPSFFANGILVHNSATPFRADGKPLNKTFDKLIHPITCKEAIEQGHLCSGIYYGIGNINMDGVTVKRNGDYDETEMYSRFSEWDITPHVVEELGKHSGQSIIFCINVAHTKEVYEAVKAAGYNVEYVIGETDVAIRNKTYQKFKDKKIQVLVNCEILTEGADFPQIENVFIVRKTKSLARYLQIVGRGARTYQEGLYKKTFFSVIDFGGNVVEHGYFEDYDEGLTLDSGAEKKMIKRKPRKCPSCQKVLLTKECNCGYVFEEEIKEKIKIDNLEIEVLNKNIINYLRLSKKKWEKVKDHELRIYAKIKGMKPGWALHEFARRHDLPKTDGWHYFVNNKLAELEKINQADYE